MTFKGPPRLPDARGGARTDRARQNNRICRKGGLERYGRSAHARGREHRRFGSDRRGQEYRFGCRRSTRDGRCRRDRARRMQRELTNGTESRVGAELRDYDPAARSRAFMKMCRANRLRHEYQRRAENRDRARRRSAAFAKPRGHQILRPADWPDSTPIEPAV